MEINSLMSFENLCKIFEMRIKLDKKNGIKTSSDVLDNYEKYSRKIDSIYNSEFQKELKPLISPAVTIEKERERLRRLIKLLEDRLDKRVSLEDRYYDVTGSYLSSLQIIVSDDELNDKRERLSVINKYLDTNSEINSVTDSINKLRDLLKEEERKRDEYEDKNKIMEDELYSAFINVIKNDEYYKELKEEDISLELDKIRSSVDETRETLEITKESIGSLATSGLDDDYTSYIEEAEKNYYSYKIKDIILKIYKLVMEFDDDFKLICSKRDKINELLEEKKTVEGSLSINNEYNLMSFEKVLSVQCNTLDNEKEVLDNIVNYTSRIDFKEERLNELKELNEDSNILSILREYGLIETYDTSDVILEEIDEEIKEDIYSEDEVEEVIQNIEIPSLEEEIVEQVYNPYRIVSVEDYPVTLNVGLAKLKGESVREKVNKKLNPKKEEGPALSDIINMDEVVTSYDNIPSNNIEEVSVVENVSPVLEVNNSVLEELPIPKIEEEKNEEVATTDIKIDTPVWELPGDNTVNNVSFEEKKDEEVLPVWTAIEPIMPKEEPTEKIDIIDSISITDKPIEVNNDFWMPISDKKEESNVFPSINIPVNTNMNNDNGFVFPTINN